MPDKITDQIYIGNIKDSHVNGKDFDYVLNLTHNETDHTTHHCPIEDGNEDQQTQYEVAYVTLCILMDRKIRSHEKILVHCHKGRSRAPSLVAAYLSVIEDIRPFEALQVIAEKRPMINPKAENLHIISRIVLDSREEQGKGEKNLLEAYRNS